MEDMDGEFQEVVGGLDEGPAPLPIVSILDLSVAINYMSEVQMYLSQFVVARLLGEELKLPGKIESLLPHLMDICAELANMMMDDVFRIEIEGPGDSADA